MMDNTAVIGPVQGTGADLVPLPLPSLEQAREYIRASKAENTLRGYQCDWRAFCEWCEGHGVCPLPASPESVASYIAECAARLKVGSIQRRLNAIAEAHKVAGLSRILICSYAIRVLRSHYPDEASRPRSHKQ